MNKSLRVIGIDPGYAIVGFGVLDYAVNSYRAADYGSIITEAGTSFDKRLEIIWDELSQLMDEHKPQHMAIERLYFSDNRKTGIDVAQARGIMILCAAKRGIPVYEYTPLQVKLSVVGYGKADKNQVQQMVKNMLHLPRVPKPDDTADALAIAICHAHTAGSLLSGRPEISELLGKGRF